ncbi:hypothetical protein [Phenylobacterium sp.]|nr:hypothetical protein [Phenylobacterium sp.]
MCTSIFRLEVAVRKLLIALAGILAFGFGGATLPRSARAVAQWN